MRAWIAGLVLLAITATAGNIYVFDPVTRYYKDFLPSVHTPAFAGRTDVLVNPALPPGIPLMFTKETNGTVIAMSLSESNAVVAAIIAAIDASVRADARFPLENFIGNGLLIRAVADLTKDEINILRNELSIAKTNITLFQSRPTLSPRTYAQLQFAITNKIAQHTVDTNTQISLLGPRKRPSIAAARAPKDSNH